MVVFEVDDSKVEKLIERIRSPVLIAAAHKLIEELKDFKPHEIVATLVDIFIERRGDLKGMDLAVYVSTVEISVMQNTAREASALAALIGLLGPAVEGMAIAMIDFMHKLATCRRIKEVEEAAKRIAEKFGVDLADLAAVASSMLTAVVNQLVVKSAAVPTSLILLMIARKRPQIIEELYSVMKEMDLVGTNASPLFGG